MRKRVTLLFAALVMALTMAFSGVAFAKIQAVDTACTNPGGHQAGGQQPSCNNDAHQQETENQNPAGHAPGGHNP
jgi:uncharacterized protein HemX